MEVNLNEMEVHELTYGDIVVYEDSNAFLICDFVGRTFLADLDTGDLIEYRSINDIVEKFPDSRFFPNNKFKLVLRK